MNKSGIGELKFEALARFEITESLTLAMRHFKIVCSLIKRFCIRDAIEIFWEETSWWVHPKSAINVIGVSELQLLLSTPVKSNRSSSSLANTLQLLREEKWAEALNWGEWGEGGVGCGQ